MKKKIGVIVATVGGAVATMLCIMKKKEKRTSYTVQNIEALPLRKMGFYEKYIKRVIDIVCALAAIICFSPIYIGVAILVRMKLGSPVLFTQDRPGLVNQDGKETIFDPRESYSFKGKDSYRYYILIKSIFQILLLFCKFIAQLMKWSLFFYIFKHILIIFIEQSQ